MKHKSIETKVGLLIGLTLFAVSIGGIVEIFPLVMDGATTQPTENVKPYTALELEGRDISSSCRIMVLMRSISASVRWIYSSRSAAVISSCFSNSR